MRTTGQHRPGSMLAAALLASLGCAAQQLPPADTTRTYPATDERHVGSALTPLGECVEVLSWGTPAAVVRSYYPSGHLHEYQPYADYARGLRHGPSSTWYDTGRLCALEPYEKGQRQGTLLLYYEDGRLKRRTEYVAGSERPGECFDAAGQPVAYFPYERLPLYPGGLDQLLAEVQHLTGRVPLTGNLLDLLTSDVVLSFLITETGEVTHPRIEQSSRVPAYDEAALQALSQLSRPWQPGYRDGQPALFRYHLRLPMRGRYSPGARRRF